MGALDYKRIFGSLKHDKKFLFKLLASGIFTSLGVHELGFNLELAFIALIFVPLAGLFFTFLKMDANTNILRILTIAVAAIALGLLTKSYFLALASFLMLEGATDKECLIRLEDFHWVRAVETEDSLKELNRLVSRHVLFRKLSKKERNTLAQACKVTSLGSGDVLIKQGEFNEYLFLIAKGTLDVISDGTSVATLGKGDIVGEVSASGLSLPVADVVASSDGMVFAFPVDAINEHVRKNPEFSESMREMGMRRVKNG